MPGPTTTRRHLPALDGLRALAVAAVLGYHLDLRWTGGGYLGVDLFFVLSGFLITGLLLDERVATGTVRVRSFWSRRARRLLPAVVLMVGAIALYAAFGGPGVNPMSLRGDGLATLFYGANWHFIANHSAYFSQFTSPSPFEHTWSLAIEEQFYLLWPLALLALVRGGGRRWRSVALAGAVSMAVASALTMAVLTGAGTDLTRAYFGTDTRAFELMIGAVLALAVHGRPAWGGARKQVLHGAGIAAFAALGVGWSLLAGPPVWMFRGGFVAAAVLAAAVILSVTQPDPGPLGRALSLGPIAWVGAVSYGLYLWHWPVYVFLTATSTGLPGWAVDLCRLTITFALAATSYYLVELPIRRHGLAGWRRAVAPAAVMATAITIVAATTPVAVAGAATPVTVGTGASAAPHVFAVDRPAGRPLRVLLIGDSVMDQAASGFAAGFAATGAAEVRSVAFPGWGLTLDPHWPSGIPAAVAQYRPDVVIGAWSWDWHVAQADPVAYRHLLDQAMSLFLTPANGVQGVVLLSFPRLGQRYGESAAASVLLEHERRAWNAIAAAEAAARPGSVAYLPAADALALSGQFAAWLPTARGDWVRARSTDNTHLCPAGTARYVGAVLADVTHPWALPAPAPGWWAGSWVHDPKYNLPSGYCPDDQPSPSFAHAYATVPTDRSGPAVRTGRAAPAPR
jgi:peptidoglycan/LPS O-acetylase OafA/YrhL